MILCNSFEENGSSLLWVPLDRNLSHVFLMIRLLPARRVRGQCCQRDLPLLILTLVTWWRHVVRSHWNAPLSCFSALSPLDESVVCSPCLRSGQLCSIPWAEYLHTLFEVFLPGAFVGVYSFSHLLIAVRTRGYFFVLCSPLLLYLVAQRVLPSVVESFQLVPMSLRPVPSVSCSFLFLSTFLVPGTTGRSRPSFAGSCLRPSSTVSSGGTGSCHWRTVLGTRTWALGVLAAVLCLWLLLAPLSWQSRDVHVCALAHSCGPMSSAAFQSPGWSACGCVRCVCLTVHRPEMCRPVYFSALTCCFANLFLNSDSFSLLLL